MFSPVRDEAAATEFEGRLNGLCSRVGRLLESRPSDAAGRSLLDELGELSLSLEEAWANGELEPERARGLMDTAAELRSELVKRGRERIAALTSDWYAVQLEAVLDQLD